MGNPSYRRESETEWETEVHLTFSAEEEAMRLGAQRATAGRKRAQ